MQQEIAEAAPIRQISMRIANLLVCIEQLSKHAHGQVINLYSDDLAALRDAYIADPLSKAILTYHGFQLMDGGPRK